MTKKLEQACRIHQTVWRPGAYRRYTPRIRYMIIAGERQFLEKRSRWIHPKSNTRHFPISSQDCRETLEKLFADTLELIIKDLKEGREQEHSDSRP